MARLSSHTMRDLCLLFLIPQVLGLRQEELNYIARSMEVKYSVIDNFRDSLKTFEAEIALTNKGREPIPGAGWEMYFCHLNLLEPEFLPSPEGAILKNYGVKFMHTQGCLFKMEPLGNFRKIPPGETKTIRLLAENFSVSKSDGIPNWYVASRGLEPRVLSNTAGEKLDFVGEFNTPRKWKRYDYITEEAEGHDRYDPFTPRVRYAMNDISNLGKAGKPLIPTPVEISIDKSNILSLGTKDWSIVSSPKFNQEAQFLADRLSLLRVTRKPSSRFIIFTEDDVSVKMNGKERRDPEAYSLTVDPADGVIEIRAGEPQGAFYAVQSLLSLMDEERKLPRVSVVDAPRYKYRGVMLDVARNFHSKQRVFRLLDMMTSYKLNKLHLHLTDDEGWRLEIPGLSELTDVGAKRCHDPQEQKCILPFLGSGPAVTPPGSGFYTTEDYRDILRYAKARHIEVIPEIDMPGHGHAAIKSMEARHAKLLAANNISGADQYTLVDYNDPSEYKSIQMYTDNAINPCMKSTYDFIAHVLQTVVDLHKDISPLKIYHFGGDEVAKGAWENSTVCDEIFDSTFGLKDKRDLKELFVRQVSNMTSYFGLDLAAWEDGVMESGSTPYERKRLRNREVYAYAWDNIWEWGAAARAYKLANAGYKVVMAQATHLYFDHPYEPDPNERGLYWAPRYTDTRKTFGFMPENMYANADVARSGDLLTKEDVCGDDGEGCIPLERAENIVGIQGHLWSELVRNPDIADYMMYPRFLALAERAWHEAPWECEKDNVTRKEMIGDDWQLFANTLGHKELKRLDRVNIKYRVPPPGGIISEGRLKTNVAYPGLKVEFSTDGGATWCQSSGDDSIQVGKQSSVLLRTRSGDGGRTSRVVSLFVAASLNTAPAVCRSVSVIISIFIMLFLR